MNIKQLEKIADKIPTMVNAACKETVRYYAAAINEGLHIVEVGSWLGACTAQIALGLVESGKYNPIYVYDHFTCRDASQIEKAAAVGYQLIKGKEYLTDFQNTIDKFGKEYYTMSGDTRKATWDKKKRIGLYIDDASKKQEAFDHAVKTFFPAFMPGVTVVMLLDFYYYEKKPQYKYQKEWMDAHKNNFKLIGRIPDSVNAVFLYKGGLNA
jgi:hypothetical protein